MKKNGFTLIELLAVIVILAIIALIATPIILGIINDAREESNERSVELYASAVRNAIAAYQLTNLNAPTKFSDLDVQYDGEVECETEELYADGSFYITGCTVNGTAVNYTYGEAKYVQVYKPRYYSWSSGYTGGKLPDDAKETVAELKPSYPFYLGLDVDETETVTAAYVCFKREENGAEYCLKGNVEYENSYYETNVTVLEEAFGASACSFDGIDFSCPGDGVGATANQAPGYVYAYNGIDGYSYDVYCSVSDVGGFGCYE